jgi:hypothetical protein
MRVAHRPEITYTSSATWADETQSTRGIARATSTKDDDMKASTLLALPLLGMGLTACFDSSAAGA